MNSTPTPKAIEPHNALIARADEQLARAHEQLARADEELAGLSEQLAKMERELSSLIGNRKVDLRTSDDLSRYFRDEVIASAELQYAQI